MNTNTDVCNMALARLGARRIGDMASDATTEAKSCRLHFAQVLDGLLRRHQWDFATVSLALSKLTDAPLSEWASAWQMPSDCVRLIRISSGNATLPIDRFARRGRHLLTEDLSSCEIVYVSNSIPVVDWDSLFVEAMSLKLASMIAGDVAQNPSLAADCLSQLESLALPHAQTADARESSSGENYGVSDLVRSSTLAQVRRARSWNPQIINHPI